MFTWWNMIHSQIEACKNPFLLGEPCDGSSMEGSCAHLRMSSHLKWPFQLVLVGDISVQTAFFNEAICVISLVFEKPPFFFIWWKFKGKPPFWNKALKSFAEFRFHHFCWFWPKNPEAPRGGYPLPLRFPDSWGHSKSETERRKKTAPGSAPLLEIGPNHFMDHFWALWSCPSLDHVEACLVKIYFHRGNTSSIFLCHWAKKNGFPEWRISPCKVFFSLKRGA